MNLNLPAFQDAHVLDAFKALRSDLLQPGGPAISTTASYRFAILPYLPQDELLVRQQVHALSSELEQEHAWRVERIDLAALLMERLQRAAPDFIERAAALERRRFARSPEQALQDLHSRLAPLLDGDDGLAADIAGRIDAFAARRSDPRDPRALVWLTRCGALYPFLRTSGLLRHLDGRTHHLPVVLLYPGEQRGPAALSFMGRMEADRDYRPRIYGAANP